MYMPSIPIIQKLSRKDINLDPTLPSKIVDVDKNARVD